ncbi:Fanconi-associated nuclease 1 [Geodia barretti]|uniref:Fanconi-associated nuclease n=1 Tax=Geodia barretti TaxID=519541 RepID=A0AA35RYX0_GEOBA|nr:Fanconi-associated nuclease 1 [Geodia barretti]
MGGELLSKVSRQFAMFYGQSCGGLPDLTLWNPSTNTCKFVEVKGPGDRLSNKQIVWLSRLASWGCQVEVCRVKAQTR